MFALMNPVHESLYDAIGRWAASAPTHLLRVLVWSGLLGAGGVMAIDSYQWPVALGLVALASVGEWGLLEHRLARRYSRPIHAVESVVAVFALVAALVTMFVALFAFLGPAPHF
jgi:hypothetical protein